MKVFLKVMRALSDPNRVKIIKMLQHKVMCVCEMQAALQIAQPSVSKYLKILEDAGLVFFHKDGMWVNYQLANGSANSHAAPSVEPSTKGNWWKSEKRKNEKGRKM